MLEILLYFLGRIEMNKEQNGMEMEALVTVFGPILLRKKDETAESIRSELPDIKIAMKTLVENRTRMTFKVRLYTFL